MYKLRIGLGVRVSALICTALIWTALIWTALFGRKHVSNEI